MSSTTVMLRSMSRERVDDNGFGDWLNDQLRLGRIGRREFAESIGVSHSTVNAWVGRHRWISEEHADKVADYFGAPRNVVREMANRPPARGPAPGMVGLRASPGVSGVASVAFVPIIGLTPQQHGRHAAELGDVMPFAAEFVARFRKPGIIIVTDSHLAHRGIRQGEGLLIEQDVRLAEIQPGALVVLREPDESLAVYTWYVDSAGGVTLVPASETGDAPFRFEPGEDEAGGCSPLVGLVRSAYSIRNLD